jgi:hypothetical protein
LNGQLVTDSHSEPYRSSETCEAIRSIAIENLEKDLENELLGYSAICKPA